MTVVFRLARTVLAVVCLSCVAQSSAASLPPSKLCAPQSYSPVQRHDLARLVVFAYQDGRQHNVYGAMITGVFFASLIPLFYGVRWLIRKGGKLSSTVAARVAARSPNEIIGSLESIVKLRDAGVYTSEEVRRRTTDLRDMVCKNGVSGDKEQFLASLLPFLKNNILSSDDINAIKRAMGLAWHEQKPLPQGIVDPALLKYQEAQRAREHK